LIKEIEKPNGLRGFIFSSGDDGDYPGCRLTFFLKSKIITYKFDTTWIKPFNYLHKYKDNHGADKSYDISCPREFSILKNDDDSHVSIRYGIDFEQVNSVQVNAPKSKYFGFFIPWLEMKYIEKRILSSDFEVVCNIIDNYEDEQPSIDAVSKVFTFFDFDGEEGIATVYISEREWSHGVKWCSWLKWFKPNFIRRTLDITFNIETGKRKGSWKGGTIGTGIDMVDGDTVESAFNRYCNNNSMTRDIVFCGEIESIFTHPIVDANYNVSITL